MAESARAFFMYDPQCVGLETFKTSAEARDAAERELGEARREMERMREEAAAMCRRAYPEKGPHEH